MRSSMTWAGLVVTLLGLSACSLGGDDTAAGTTERARPADCEPPRSRVNGGEGADDGAGSAVTSGPQTLRFDGQDRAYLLALPDSYDGTTAHPLLLSLHGWGSSKEEFEELTALAERGAARGYVVVTPDALGEPPEWNMFEQQGRADDYGFADALVEDLSGRLCIDPTRVYAAGMSAGSAFTGFLACREPYRFAAVAMVAAFIPTTCPAARAGPSVVAIHGTADPVVPYQGGQVAGGGTGIPAALDTFTQYGEDYGCAEPVVEPGPVAGVERRRLRECTGGRDVVLYTVADGGHEWPGATGTGLAAAGEQLFATDTILDFFDHHVKPTP